MIELLTVLGGVVLEHYRTLPNYEQEVEREYNEKLAEYIRLLDSAHPMNDRIDELETWLKVFGEGLKR